MDEAIIDSWLEKEIFSPIDIYFARALIPDKKELAFVPILSYLLSMARQGHLCIKMEQERIYPPPSLLCTELGEEKFLEQKILQNFSFLPMKLCEEMVSQEQIPSTPLCRFQDELYLQKNWLLQQELVRHIRRLQEYPPLLPVSMNLQESVLNEEQKIALQGALSSPISLISGGPGTGKTFTAAQIVRTFLQGIPEKERGCMRVKLAAPTGKAAALLEKNLKGQLGCAPEISCGTLHSFLKNRAGFSQSFFADLLLIDEASMLDARLFVRMLRSLQGGGRLVLMGDKDQLPPVEAGGFFADLIDRSQEWNLPVTILQKSLRTEKTTLQVLSQAILLQDKKKIEQMEEVTILPSLRDSFVKKQIEQGCKDYLLPPYQEEMDYVETLQAMERFRILSPLRKGPLGVEEINRRILENYIKVQNPEAKLICPILITKNDAARSLMNGDTGILVATAASLKKGAFTAEDRAYFLSRTENGQVMEWIATALPSFSFAYCLSIHKSQGSEYDSVLVLIPPGSERFGREVLYTAVTRAKKQVSLIVEEKTLQALLEKSSRKISGFTKTSTY